MNQGSTARKGIRRGLVGSLVRHRSISYGGSMGVYLDGLVTYLTEGNCEDRTLAGDTPRGPFLTSMFRTFRTIGMVE